MPCDSSQNDEMTVGLRAHVRQCRSHDIHRTEEVGFKLISHEVLVTLRCGQLFYCANDGLAGAAKENVDSTENMDCFGHRSLTLAHHPSGNSLLADCSYREALPPKAVVDTQSKETHTSHPVQLSSASPSSLLQLSY